MLSAWHAEGFTPASWMVRPLPIGSSPKQVLARPSHPTAQGSHDGHISPSFCKGIPLSGSDFPFTTTCENHDKYRWWTLRGYDKLPIQNYRLLLLGLIHRNARLNLECISALNFTNSYATMKSQYQWIEPSINNPDLIVQELGYKKSNPLVVDSLFTYWYCIPKLYYYSQFNLTDWQFLADYVIVLAV